MASNDLDDIVSARLRAGEQRYTRGRRRIVDAIRAANGPVTVQQILTSDDRLAQSSTYRNLAVLEEVGVVTRIVTSHDFARYELAEDLTEHHHHLICSACGDVADFSLRPKTEAELERALERVARRSSFAIDGHRLDLVGLCGECS